MSFNRRNWLRPLAMVSFGMALAALLGLAWPHTARAQAPRPKSDVSPTSPTDAPHDDPRARSLFDEVATAYKGLSSYSDQGEFTVAMTVAGKASKQVVPLKIALVRPNKFDIETNVARLTSDGKTLTTAVIPLKRYMSGPAPQRADLDTFREGPIGASLFGGPSGIPMFVLLSLLTSPEPRTAIAQIGGSLQLDGANADGKRLVLEFGKRAPRLLLTIDPAIKLLSSIELKVAPEVLKESKIAVQKIGWSAGAISTRAVKDRSFAFEIPKGFTKLDTSLEGRGEAQASDARVSKPAPDFTLTLLDGPEKTRTVTKAELAGKVVVIDFWATWCGPCLQELPEIQKLVESYAKTKKEVLVVALSQDDEPAEITQLRKLVEKTLANKKINLTTNPVGKIGLDPSKSVGTAFELEGYPTLVILDGKGVVQSVHVGFDPTATEPLHKTLAKEIDTLLEGKSLTTPKEPAKGSPKTSAKKRP